MKILNRISTVIVLLLGTAVIITLQFSIPTLFGADGYLHIRMAEVIRHSGPIQDFHWARFSVFAENFADKDFLYHVFLIPFTFGSSIFFGAKVASCFFAVLFLGVFFIVLRRFSSPLLVPVGLLAVLLSSDFLHSLSRPRPMVFVITLTLLAIYCLIEKRFWMCFIIAVVYSLSHVSGPFMLVYALITETVRFFSKKEFCFKTVLAVALGILLATLIHPNFPDNLQVFYLNAVMVPVYAVKWGLELGAEFFPLSTREYLISFPLIIPGILTILSFAHFSQTRPGFATRVIFTHSALFFFFSFLSRRYIVHAYPLIILWLAAYTSDYLQGRGLHIIFRENRLVTVASGVVLCLLFLIAARVTYSEIRDRCLSDRLINSHYEKVAEWMDKNIPDGEVIFHSNWSDSQYFIGLNPGNDYFVTLDPVYMYRWNPQLYNLYRDISFGRTEDPYGHLKNTFRVKYGYAGKNYFGALIRQIRADRRFKILAENGYGLIFGLR